MTEKQFIDKIINIEGVKQVSVHMINKGFLNLSITYDTKARFFRKLKRQIDNDIRTCILKNLPEKTRILVTRHGKSLWP